MPSRVIASCRRATRPFYDLPALCDVYGPQQDVHGEAGVVAIFWACLVGNRAPTVLGEGRQARDRVDISDICAPT
jgi:UDP-glucose 4-epimerase